MKKHYLYVLVGIALLLVVLPGCISRQVASDEESTVALTESNSRQVSDEKNVFSLNIPNDYEILVELEDAGARLLKITKKDTDPPEVKMYIEESPTTVEKAIEMLIQTDAMTIVSSNDFEVNGFPVKILNVNLVYAEGEVIPFYFLRASEKTYIFSLAMGQTWQFARPIVESFNLSQ